MCFTHIYADFGHFYNNLYTYYSSILKGMIIFANGKIGGGSPKCGKPYWSEPQTPFIDMAKEYLKDSKTCFPEIDYSIFSHTQQRYKKGYNYCKDNINKITSKIAEGETIKFIAHSMGCSFVEGMAQYLIDQGYTVTTMIHINAFQAGEMTANTEISCTIDYQYTDDIILHIPFLSCVGNIKGAIVIREKSNTCIRRRHRGPVYPNSAQFWHSIKSVLK